MLSQRKPCKHMMGDGTLFPPVYTAIINSTFEAIEHSHSFIEILYFESGQGKHVINGREYPIQAGDIYLINANVKHSYSVTKAEKDVCVKNCIFYADKFNIPATEFIEQYYYRLFKKNIPFEHADFVYLNGDYQKDILHLLQLIENELKLGQSLQLDVIDNALNCILIRIFRSYASPNHEHYMSNENIVAMEESIEYIKKNFAASLSLSEVAANVNLSENYFNLLFKKYTSLTMKKYQQKIRCQEACILLENTNMTMEAICEAVGYIDIKQFFYIFKRVVGVPPGVYRKETASKSTSKDP